jgi:hypothetical protein
MKGKKLSKEDIVQLVLAGMTLGNMKEPYTLDVKKKSEKKIAEEVIDSYLETYNKEV